VQWKLLIQRKGVMQLKKGKSDLMVLHGSLYTLMDRGVNVVMVGIIGRHTGEILFIGIKNKFCSICARTENKNEQTRDHVCFKNWNYSVPAMESAMAVERFSMSEEMHNLRYIQFIADGDASVFEKIKENISYGKDVRKIECTTNHAFKNYGKHLRKVKSGTHIEVEKN
jgi:hypothetical protein